jgi:hypothetical protein
MTPVYPLLELAMRAHDKVGDPPHGGKRDYSIRFARGKQRNCQCPTCLKYWERFFAEYRKLAGDFPGIQDAIGQDDIMQIVNGPLGECGLHLYRKPGCRAQISAAQHSRAG